MFYVFMLTEIDNKLVSTRIARFGERHLADDFAARQPFSTLVDFVEVES